MSSRSRHGTFCASAPARIRIGRTPQRRPNLVEIVCRPIHVTGRAPPSVTSTRSPRRKVSTATSPPGVLIRVPGAKQSAANEEGSRRLAEPAFDVLDQISAGLGAVGHPQLIPIGSVMGREQHLPVANER